ncbi:dimethylarginine dimethylaminohydrolase family protein [Cytobacillus sp. FSL K6-0265]|uniref:dimethylarginine dimethylaminohydrolase family protein n=1 Tax=Cytobacillus sp. FSL K6-0265 TaxID=2921448 RepID=UPI0030F60D22
MLDSQYKAQCSTEYDRLKTVILCEPTYMNIENQINETQRRYSDKGFNVEQAIIQHQQFVAELEGLGIEVVLLPPGQNYPEQVFTRDIGFTLGHTVFIAAMATKIRHGEEDILHEWLESHHVSYNNIKHGHVEGGDVIIDQDTVYIGQSDRSDTVGIHYLQSKLPHMKVLPVPFTKSFLHLDCIFNVLSPTEALLYPGQMDEKVEEYLYSRYDIIEVSKEEQFTLGTNVLSVGNRQVFSQPINTQVNRALSQRGFEVIEVNISEIIKSGGAFRCCTMPLLRLTDPNYFD